uniref:Uncharacterized protein n=1 Tax=Tetranychus urticae TaxID=32264 RepID=T1K4C2_TETUR
MILEQSNYCETIDLGWFLERNGFQLSLNQSTQDWEGFSGKSKEQ